MVQETLFHSITLSGLEFHLQKATRILRGSSVDRTDWTNYVALLPLLQTEG
jgi:hypothetical protein